MSVKIFAKAAILVALAISPVAAEARRPVEKQLYDTSCSLGSAVFLLAEAGFNISESTLVEAYRKNIASTDNRLAVLNEGLSVRELIKLVTSLNLGVRLEATVVSRDRLTAYASAEPIIAYLREPKGKSGEFIGHFTVLSGYSKTRKAYLRADSVMGNYLFHDEESFVLAARVRPDQEKILIFRLRGNNEMPLARNPEITAAEETRISELSSSRLLSAMSRSNDTFATLSVNYDTSKLTPDEFALKSSGVSASLSLSTPIARNLVLNARVPFSFGKSWIDAPGMESFDLGQSTQVGDFGMGVTHHFGVPGAKNTDLFVGGELRFENLARFSGWQVNGGVNYAITPSTVLSGQLLLDAQRHNSEWFYGLSPSASMTYALGPRTSVGVDVAGFVSLNDNDPFRLYISAAIQRQINRSTSVGITASSNAVGPKGFQSRSVGISLTKRFGRDLH